MDIEIKDGAGTEPLASAPTQRTWLFLQRHARRIAYSYAVVLLLVTSFQAVCLLLILRQSQGWAQYWASFGRDFATSPAAAGLCAVIAAWLGATQLSRQLTQSKKKAAEEAWWQQFEWVTDRIVSTRPKGEKDDTRLPSSLAFELMTALSRSATEAFQEAAVTGILNHYLKDFGKQQARTPHQGETPTSQDPGKSASDTPVMDREAAEALRNLIDELPPSSRSPARKVLETYEHDYEDEVLKALRHRFSAVKPFVPGRFEADAIIQVGSQKVIAEVRSSILSQKMLTKIGSQVLQIMSHEKASGGVIITARATLNTPLQDLAKDGIHLIEWEPSMGSFALYSEITRMFGDNAA